MKKKRVDFPKSVPYLPEVNGKESNRKGKVKNLFGMNYAVAFIKMRLV